MIIHIDYYKEPETDEEGEEALNPSKRGRSESLVVVSQSPGMSTNSLRTWAH